MRNIVLTALLIALTTSAHATGTNNGDRTLTDPRVMQHSDWSDPAELARTWDAAIVYLPQPDRRFVATTLAKVQAGHSPHHRLPTVIFMHGCGGIWEGTHERLALFASNGYAAIAPVSFARKKYPQSCDPAAKRAGSTANMPASAG